MTNTTAAETIEVPQHIIDTSVSLFAVAAEQGQDFTPAVTDALRSIVNHDLPAGRTPGTVRLDAVHAWHLSNVGDALDTFGLDEDDPAAWRHPSVVAQQTLDQALYDQAPNVAARLTAELEASVADAA